jgi:hypothetical protein
MKRMNLRSTLGAAILIGGAVIGASALADPEQGAYGYGMGPGMMGGNGPGWMGGYGSGWMGGYGGIWLPLLVVIVVAGLVVWIVKQKGK